MTDMSVVKTIILDSVLGPKLSSVIVDTIIDAHDFSPATRFRRMDAYQKAQGCYWIGASMRIDDFGNRVYFCPRSRAQALSTSSIVLQLEQEIKKIIPDKTGYRFSKIETEESPMQHHIDRF